MKTRCYTADLEGTPATLHPGALHHHPLTQPVSKYLRREASDNSQRIQREQLSAGETCHGYRAWEEVGKRRVTELVSVATTTLGVRVRGAPNVPLRSISGPLCLMCGQYGQT